MYWPTFAFLGISIHAPSRERRITAALTRQANVISIHAPSRERQFNLGEGLTITDISIHAPSRERRYRDNGRVKVRDEFQSTLPRGSDSKKNIQIFFKKNNFNPRSLAGATLLFSIS